MLDYIDELNALDISTAQWLAVFIHWHCQLNYHAALTM
ncbi:hypothetical protein [Escherichia coli]